MAVCEDLFPGRFVSAEFFRLEIKIGMPYSRIARRNAGEKVSVGLARPSQVISHVGVLPTCQSGFRIPPVVAKANQLG